jgi:hypothetical protein
MHPADWYDDPNDPHQLRWWDGRRWTRHTELHTDWPGSRPPTPVDEIQFADVGRATTTDGPDVIRFDTPF